MPRPHLEPCLVDFQANQTCHLPPDKHPIAHSAQLSINPVLPRILQPWIALLVLVRTVSWLVPSSYFRFRLHITKNYSSQNCGIVGPLQTTALPGCCIYSTTWSTSLVLGPSVCILVFKVSVSVFVVCNLLSWRKLHHCCILAKSQKGSKCLQCSQLHERGNICRILKQSVLGQTKYWQWYLAINSFWTSQFVSARS